MKYLDNIEDLEYGNIILYVKDDACLDCINTNKYIAKIEELHNNKWLFYEVNRSNIEIVKFYDIIGVPSFLAFKDGVVTAAFISKDSKSFLEIHEWIEKFTTKGDYI